MQPAASWKRDEKRWTITQMSIENEQGKVGGEKRGSDTQADKENASECRLKMCATLWRKRKIENNECSKRDRQKQNEQTKVKNDPYAIFFLQNKIAMKNKQ